MSQLRSALIIGQYTFRELYKSRIMLNCLFLGLLLVFLIFVASEFTYGTPQKVAIDFGLGITGLSAIMIAIFMGTALVAREIEQKTVYIVLSRSVSRASFLVGKALGIALILFLNTVILFSLTVGFYVFLGGELSQVIFFAALFSYLESLIVLFFVILFSLITNTALSVLFTLGIYFSGHALPKAMEFVSGRNESLEKLMTVFSFVIPDLTKLNIRAHVVYREFLSSEYILKSLTYGIVYLMALFTVCLLVFNKKNLD